MTVSNVLIQKRQENAEPAWEIATLFPNQGAWSEADYLELDTNHLVELSHGFIEVLPMPSDRHQAIVGFLYAILLTFSQQLGGTVRLSPLRLRLWPGKIREPDLLYLASATDPRRQAQLWTGADLVVEVISPDDPDRDLVQKRLEYAQAGIPEYWIVDPRTETILVLELTGNSYHENGLYGRGDHAASASYPALKVNVSAALDAP